MKKKKQRSYKMSTSTELDYMKVVKISVGVLLILVIVYLSTAIMSGEIKLGNKKKPKESVSIQYSEIMAGQTFNRNENEYYVLFYDFEDDYADYYKSLISSYAYKTSLPIYTVNMEKKMNSDYAINELKIDSPTILKISNKNRVETIIGKDEVINYLNK